MGAAQPRVDHPVRAAWPARIALRIDRRGARSVLGDCSHYGPLRIQKLLYPEGEHLAHALLLHPPGGIAGGDELDIRVQLGAGARLLLTTPGAAKWYKAAGRVARQDVQLDVAAGATLEWLPQETIVFDAAQAEQTLRIDCAADALCCGWDIVVLGRQARDERFRHGHWRQRIEIRRDGELLWTERSSLCGDDPLLESIAGWNGAHVSGLFWLLGAAPDEALLEQCRALPLPAGVRCGMTQLPDGPLLVRALGRSAEQVRDSLMNVWMQLRPALLGAAAQAPRIWST